jgi:hypothetical protein
MKKNVHPLTSPKIRMAKVRNAEKPQKQILDQTPVCGKESVKNFQNCQNNLFRSFLTIPV